MKQQVFPADFGGKAGVAVLGNFHSILVCVLFRLPRLSALRHLDTP
jgi:hypothetical protein